MARCFYDARATKRVTKSQLALSCHHLLPLPCSFSSYFASSFSFARQQHPKQLHPTPQLHLTPQSQRCLIHREPLASCYTDKQKVVKKNIRS